MIWMLHGAASRRPRYVGVGGWRSTAAGGGVDGVVRAADDGGGGRRWGEDRGGRREVGRRGDGPVWEENGKRITVIYLCGVQHTLCTVLYVHLNTSQKMPNRVY